MRLSVSSLAVLLVANAVVTICVQPTFAQDLSHRKSDLTISVVDSSGNAINDATIDVKMTKHAFKFGTQIRDRFFSITEPEFNALSTTGRQALLPDLTGFGTPRYTPTWQDALNYRTEVFENFNHLVPTTGMQWLSLNNNGPATPDAAISMAQAGGLSVTGASVVWQRDRWPTPVDFRSAANPNAQEFHDALVADRLGANGVLGRFSDPGAGPTIGDWKVLNEPLHESYYADTFVSAGIYADQIEAQADYFKRARNVATNATLAINEFGILNSANDNSTIEYRDLVNDLLAAGAPIDTIGVQAHISRTDLTKADITRRLDILAETGLKIEITEFDSRDDANQLTTAQQEQIFRDVLEASFEHTEVDGFIMWGHWDPGHWRGNGPLFNEDWTQKAEAAPWFDLVRGDWMTDLVDLGLDSNGSWTANDGLFDGEYEFTVNLANGSQKVVRGVDIGSISSLVIAVPEPSAGCLLLLFLGAGLSRRRREWAAVPFMREK